MKTSVVIPNYIINEELFDLVKQAVKSFREHTEELELILVDDGSPIKYAAEWLEKNADIYIKNEKNSGFAVSCNNGFRQATGHFIVCANNDIEVYRGYWEALTQPFEMFDGVGVTGLISYKSKMPEGVSIQDWKIKKITDGGLLNGWMQSGGLWCSTRDIMNECGMFDEQFFRGGYEDVDLFLRYQKMGKKLIMSGLSPFWHKEGATRWNPKNGYANESKQIENENRIKFRNKWGWDYPSHNPWREIELWRA